MKIKAPMAIVSASALAEYVATNHGLEVRAQDGKDKILAKMAEAGVPTDYIEIENDEPEPVVKRVEPVIKKRHTPGKRMCQIQIESQDKPGGSEPVFTSVNGVHILIPRGQKVWVDFKYVHALQNASQSVPDKLGENNEILSWKTIPEVPMAVWATEPPLSQAELDENKVREAEAIAAREAAARAESGMEAAA